MQEIEIEMVGPQTGEATLASAFNTIARRVRGQTFETRTTSIALISDNMADLISRRCRRRISPPCRLTSYPARGRCVGLLPQRIAECLPRPRRE